MDYNDWALRRYEEDIEIAERRMEELDEYVQVDILDLQMSVDMICKKIAEFNSEYGMYVDEREYVKDILGGLI